MTLISTSIPTPLPAQAIATSQKSSGVLNGSDLKATVKRTENGFAVTGFEKLAYTFVTIDDIFSLSKTELASVYRMWGRCLLVTDQIVWGFYQESVEKYFNHHNISLTTKIMAGGELHKVGFNSSFDSLGFLLDRLLLMNSSLKSELIRSQKTMDTMLSLVDAFNDFGLVRKVIQKH